MRRAILFFLAMLSMASFAAPFAYVTNLESNDVTVIDLATNCVVATVPVGRGPIGVAIDPAGTFVYVGNYTDNTVSVIATPANAVVATVRVGTHPWGLAIDPAGKRVYVANTDSHDVTVIDTASHQVVATVPVGGNPRGLAVHPTNGRVYVANYCNVCYESVVSIIEGDTLVVDFVYVGRKLVSVSIPADGRHVRVVGEEGMVWTLDPATGGKLATVQGVPAIVGGTQNAAGTRLYVPRPAYNELIVFNPDAAAIEAQLTIGCEPSGVAVHPAGTYVYVVNAAGNNVSVMETATRRIVELIPVGKRPITVGNFIGGPGATFQGLWWKSPPGSESGWGLNIAHQGDTIFATWYTYDTDGNPLWLAMSNGARVGPETFSGELYRHTGPAFNAASWDPASVTTTPVGQATLAFTDADNGTFAYTVNGIARTKAITRQSFATPMPLCERGATPGATPNYQDLWWRSPPGSEAGWGLNIAHQGDTIFATWFTYDAAGKGLWLFMSNGARTGPATYSGALHRATGPAFSAEPWNPGDVQVTVVGTATLGFTAVDAGTFTYTVDGQTQSKAITRQVFSSPLTICR